MNLEARQRDRERKSKWETANPDKRRSAVLKYRYGITLEQYNDMLAGQNFTCKLCGTGSPGGTKRNKHFHVDHCHTTGRVRGLLCRGCNTSLGGLQHDPALLRKAATYLEEENNNDRLH